MSKIHATAIVDKAATIDDSCIIGPYCVIGPDVVLGENVILESHVCISGRTTFGAGNHVFPFACIGMPPQDLKYNGEPSEIIIGESNTIREHVTIHPGTKSGGMKTIIGNNCLIMASAHIAHDCMIGDEVVIANNAILAGHVVIEDNAILGGLSAYHQFVRIGKHAIVGGGSIVVDDVIPYGHAVGGRAFLNGLNLVGLKRHNVSRDIIHKLQQIYDELFVQESPVPLLEKAKAAQNNYQDCMPILELLDFIINSGKRYLCKPNPNNKKKKFYKK